MDFMKRLFVPDLDAKDQNFAIRPSELVSVSQLAKNPTKYVNIVLRTGGRVVLTRNGMPVAGIVPLEVLAWAQSHGFPKQQYLNENFDVKNERL
jgi:prevent-host-death family protein